MSLNKILEKVTDLAKGIISEEAFHVDKNATWPEKSMRALQEAGLGGLVISPKYGGLGEGMYSLVRVCEILGASCASTSSVTECMWWVLQF